MIQPTARAVVAIHPAHRSRPAQNDVPAIARKPLVNCAAAGAMRNPFDSSDALTHSSYCGHRDGELVRMLDAKPVSAFARRADTAFRTFVGDRSFSCLGAKAAVNSETYRLGAYTSLRDRAVIAGLARDIFAFVQDRRTFKSNFTSFVAIFEQQVAGGERGFESALWTALQRLHDLDRVHHGWDPRVASDPADPRFSFSLVRTAFFVVGLSPDASRKARRFGWPALVFNAHEQFDDLRAAGRFDLLQQRIRERERNLDDSLNPNLAAYGERSESLQYSGRAVGDAWRCPFKGKPA